MKVKEYVINKLKELCKVFPNIKMEYYYDQREQVSTIKVSPKEMFLHDNKYANAETDFILDFVEKFPFDEVVFVDDKFELEDVFYVTTIKSKDYSCIISKVDSYINYYSVKSTLTVDVGVEDLIGVFNSINEVVDVLKNEKVDKIEIEPVEYSESSENYVLAA